MIVRVYFYKESDAEIILSTSKISRQAFHTLYDLVWNGEFKNILNPGRIWLKFKEETNPFGIFMEEKRTHDKIAIGDIIQIASDFYMVNQIGIKKINVVD